MCSRPVGPASAERALVLGATGLVGTELIAQLIGLQHYEEIVLWTRRPLPACPPFDNPLCTSRVFILDDMADHGEDMRGAHIYVCLGTTLKQAGSRTGFRKVDHDYVLAAAQLAAANKATSFVWISSIGANPTSGSFYLRVKGEVEQAIAGIPGLHARCVNPSLLLGQRQGFRLGESLGIGLMTLLRPLMIGPLKLYRPVDAGDVAQQMIALQASF